MMKPTHEAKPERLRRLRRPLRQARTDLPRVRHAVLCRDSHGMWQYTHPVRRYAQRDVLLALSFVLGKAQSDGLHKKTSKQEIPEHLLANLPLADHSERM